MKFLKIYSTIILVIALVSLIIVGYWLLYPYSILEFKNEPFPVKNKIVKQGSSVAYEVNYCKNMDIGATVTRTFENSILYATPTFASNRPKGCETNLVYVEIPKELPPGKYSIKTVYRFNPNPIREIDHKGTTEKFTVVEGVSKE